MIDTAVRYNSVYLIGTGKTFGVVRRIIFLANALICATRARSTVSRDQDERRVRKSGTATSVIIITSNKIFSWPTVLCVICKSRDTVVLLTLYVAFEFKKKIPHYS